MGISLVPVGWEHEADGSGCAYILDEADGRRSCGAPCREASSYCPPHHALCHVSYGSEAEADRLREVEALAKAVGGRRSRHTIRPSRVFLRRLEQAARGSSRPNCS
jgi:hypothetical protein